MLTGPMKFSAKSLSALYTRALFSAPKYPITYHPQVHDALQAGRPVVALETAVVTHGEAKGPFTPGFDLAGRVVGLPSPINLDTALSCESIIRSTGAIPATIGMISGEIFVGLRRDQLERLADDSNATRVKLSRRDLGPAIAAKCDGGTTIAGTMLIAHLSGIKVFATGGLGGVHRGGENCASLFYFRTGHTSRPINILPNSHGCVRRFNGAGPDPSSRRVRWCKVDIGFGSYSGISRDAGRHCWNLWRVE